MKLRRVVMKNFMPFKGTQEIHFPEHPSRNVMLVFGDNMRGKTSLLNAIRWGFYEEALGRHMRAIPLYELPNKDAAADGDWDMQVEIHFTAGGHQYELIRRAVKHKLVATPNKDDHFEVTPYLKKDGTVIPHHQIDFEINKHVPRQVSRFFLFDGELLQEYENLLIEGNDQGKKIKESIEQVLGVPSLINGREDASGLLRKYETQQNKALEKAKGAERLVAKRKESQSKIDTLEADLQSLKKTLAETVASREQLDDELDKSEGVYQAKAMLDQNLLQQTSLKSELKDLLESRLRLASKAWRGLISSKIRLKRAALISEVSDHKKISESRIQIEHDIRLLQEILDIEKCQTCSQPVAGPYRSGVSGRISELQTQLFALRHEPERISSLTAELSALDHLVTENLSPLFEEKDRKAEELEVKLMGLENKEEALKEELRGHDTVAIARDRQLRDRLMKEEGKLGADIDDRQSKLTEERKELESISRQIEALPDAANDRSSARVNIYRALSKCFNESIEHLRDTLKSSVEARASSAFIKMTTQKDYSGLKINSNYGLTILDELGNPVSVRSAGAEQVVALSLIDGLSKTGRPTGPVVMDTPFGRLDTKHRDRILRHLPSAASQLILLVHDGEIRRDGDLDSISERIGATYTISHVNPRFSRISKE